MKIWTTQSANNLTQPRGYDKTYMISLAGDLNLLGSDLAENSDRDASYAKVSITANCSGVTCFHARPGKGCY
jgi:hypothetical protein